MIKNTFLILSPTNNIHVITSCSLTVQFVGATSELNRLKYSPKPSASIQHVQHGLHQNQNTPLWSYPYACPMPNSTKKLLQIHYTLCMCALVLLYFLFMFSFTTSSWDQSYSLSLFLPPFPFSHPSTACHTL